MRHLLSIQATAMALATLCTTWSCGGGQSTHRADADTTMHSLPDTLRVGTLYSPTSYFIYREEQMGYDYDLVTRLGADKGMVIDLQVAPNLPALIEMLDSGKIDLAAYEIPITAEYKEHIVPAGDENITTQVLVQPKGNDRITDVTQLAGREVYVEAGSKYLYRLENLNNEIGGGIKIHQVKSDTLITEDLIDMVASGEIPLTIVDSDIARINRTYYNSLDIGLPVSFEQRSAWGVAPSMPWLADSITEWMGQPEPRKTQASLLKRYFELSKETPAFNVDFSKGKISPYDQLFRKYAKEIGWDWRILAAQGYTESRFDTTVVSWAGARGIMQIMPRTARAHGLSASMITNPEANIRTAAAIMKSLDNSLAKRVPDPQERRKFTLAAYNSGLAHIYDAIALAEKYGKNPRIWEGNVADALLMKSNPEYYNDPVCKYGYFRGKQTTAYVRKVMDFYNRSTRHVKA